VYPRLPHPTLFTHSRSPSGSLRGFRLFALLAASKDRAKKPPESVQRVGCAAFLGRLYNEFMKRVITFGSFDPLHEGHRDFLHQAKELGDYLLVVVSSDAAIRQNKGYEPHESSARRVAKLQAVDGVDEVRVGSSEPHDYELLRDLLFDVVALGYDQQPSDEAVRRQLQRFGKEEVLVVRLKPFEPQRYKSTFFRADSYD
jgi:cytidyltransferase-like protein